jgi:hypothetical protein
MITVELLTKELMRRIPKCQDGKGDEAVVYAKFFTPDSNWTWYVTEAVAILEDDSEVSLKELDGRPFVDVRFFGLVEGHARELGYFSLRELESVRGPLGLPIERDRFWREVPLKSV